MHPREKLLVIAVRKCRALQEEFAEATQQIAYRKSFVRKIMIDKQRHMSDRKNALREFMEYDKDLRMLDRINLDLVAIEESLLRGSPAWFIVFVWEIQHPMNGSAKLFSHIEFERSPSLEQFVCTLAQFPFQDGQQLN